MNNTSTPIFTSLATRTPLSITQKKKKIFFFFLVLVFYGFYHTIKMKDENFCENVLNQKLKLIILDKKKKCSLISTIFTLNPLLYNFVSMSSMKYYHKTVNPEKIFMSFEECLLSHW